MANPNFSNTYEDDLFYFESDHLALKGNKDYCDVLKTLVVLSAQREKAIKDYNKVVEIRKKALEDPFRILEDIQRGDDLGVPAINDLPKLPNINFEKFDIKVPDEDLKIIYTDSFSNKPEEEFTNIKQNTSNNKVWTTEEQKRLEELLVIYPPEIVEMRRFKKIARALGNKTVQQVSSRVQKYFLKLYKAGLPIPGRNPKSSEKYKKPGTHKHQRHNHYLSKPTTFFPDLCVPVMMNDLDNIPGPGLNSSSPSTSASGSSNYLIPTDYHNNLESTVNKTKQELHLDLLKRIRAEKAKEQERNNYLFRHFGFRCDYCDVEPILGSRWHCMTCTDSVDYCTDCLLSQMYSDNCHPMHHRLAVFHNDTENPSLPISDSDSHSESATTKNFETDSNYSGDFDTNSCDRKLNECCEDNYNALDLVEQEEYKDNSNSDVNDSD